MKNFLGLSAGALICIASTIGHAATNETASTAPVGRQTHAAMVSAQADQARAAAGKPSIRYRGGPIMLGTNTLYLIYYGSFPVTGSSSDTTAVIDDFFASVGGSGNYNVNTTYYDSTGAYISNSLAFNAATNVYYDNYSIGTSVTTSGITKIVSNAINGGHLPVDTAGIYFVVTSPDASNQLNGYCAYHTSSNSIVPGKTIIYSAIPDFGGSALQACSGNYQNYGETNSPNNNPGADNVLDSFMHELSEAVTDPLGNAWDSPIYGENGDLCNFNYGTTYIAPNGTHANTHLGSRDYLVQTIWEYVSSKNQFCANHLP